MPLEGTIVKSIEQLLAQRGAWRLKTHGAGVSRNGIPDILACYRGHFLAIEVKQPGNRPTRLQQHELNEITRAGGAAIAANHRDQVTELLDRIDAQEGRP